MIKRLIVTYICFLSYISSYSQCDSTQIVNLQCSCSNYIVNVFTPNDDGLNDRFGFFSNCELSTNYNLKIFNRFGEIIFETSDFKQEWDGYYKGKLCSSGFYTCSISYQYKYEKGIKNISRRLLLKI